MIELVDSHCHIQSIGQDKGEKGTRALWQKASDLTADQAIDSASKEGVTRLICVGCDLEDSRLAIDFVKDKDNCWASAGIHPHEARNYLNNSNLKQQFEDLIAKPKVVAIGECGLDYYYNHSEKDAQIAILIFQLELAIKYNKPLIFHVREAFSDFWPILDKYDGLRAVLHSFTDTKDNLDIGLSKGFFVGVNGIVTFTKDDAQKDVYKSIPINNLLLETDSPFLTPAPYRGTINEPKRLRQVAGYMAESRDQSLESLAKQTTINAKNLFGI
jgi:TatD DNase family protein